MKEPYNPSKEKKKIKYNKRQEKKKKRSRNKGRDPRRRTSSLKEKKKAAKESHNHIWIIKCIFLFRDLTICIRFAAFTIPRAWRCGLIKRVITWNRRGIITVLLLRRRLLPPSVSLSPCLRLSPLHAETTTRPLVVKRVIKVFHLVSLLISFIQAAVGFLVVTAAWFV